MVYKYSLSDPLQKKSVPLSGLESQRTHKVEIKDQSVKGGGRGAQWAATSCEWNLAAKTLMAHRQPSISPFSTLILGPWK